MRGVQPTLGSGVSLLEYLSGQLNGTAQVGRGGVRDPLLQKPMRA